MSWFHARWQRRMYEIRGYDDIAPASETLYVAAKGPRADRPSRNAKARARREPKPAREPIPGPRRSTVTDSLTGRLVDRWCDASVAAGWASPGRWWNSAVDDVIDAVLDDGDHIGPCSELARRRARDGVGLDETLRDLEALYTAARLGPPPFEVVRAVALAWTEISTEYEEARGCVDRRSGLATGAHVRARLSELYREATWAGHSLSETHCLVVVELAEADEGDLWNDALRMSDVAECMFTVFDAGQTIGLAAPGRAIAVVAKSSELPRNVECLRRLLNDWHHFGSSGPCPRIWTESLPSQGEAAGRLLNDLSC